MRKINKIFNIASIFTLIGVFLCQDLYALRVPMNGHEKVGKALASGQGIEESLVKFTKKFHPIVDKMVERVSRETGFTLNGKKVIVSDYPLGCARGAIATKYMLQKLCGDRITVQLFNASHPEMERLKIGKHIVNIILDNATGKKYFMSFFEGIWNDTYPHERMRQIKFFMSFNQMRIDYMPTPKYSKWFKKQRFPAVLFEFKENEDITGITGLTLLDEFKEEGLPESETKPIFSYIENAVSFDKWHALLDIDQILSSTASRSDT